MKKNSWGGGGGGGATSYQLLNIVGHHGWPTKKNFGFKSSTTDRKT